MKLKVSLFKKGDIDRAIKEIEKYQKSLVDKSERFCRRLAEIGVMVAKATLTTGQGDSSRDAAFDISFTADGEIVECTLSVTGETRVTEDGRVFNTIFAWEFGSGIYYNNGNINPHAHELGMGVGTFPNQKFAFSDHWWYRDDNGNLRMSQGTQATMPMYRASLEMMQNIETIAREVYSS